MIVEPFLEYLDGVFGEVAATLADGDDAGRRVGLAGVHEADAPRAVRLAVRAALVVVRG